MGATAALARQAEFYLEVRINFFVSYFAIPAVLIVVFAGAKIMLVVKLIILVILIIKLIIIKRLRV